MADQEGGVVERCDCHHDPAGFGHREAKPAHPRRGRVHGQHFALSTKGFGSAVPQQGGDPRGFPQCFDARLTLLHTDEICQVLDAALHFVGRRLEQLGATVRGKISHLTRAEFGGV